MRDPRFARDWERHHQASPEDIAKAQEIAKALAEGPADKALLDAAWESIEEKHRNTWSEFFEAFVTAARSSPETQRVWAETFERAFAAAQDSLGSRLMLIGDEHALQSATTDWNEERDPFSVWESDRYEIHRAGDKFYDCSGLLLRIAPDRGSRALDSLPYPGLMSELLVISCQEDRELIEELIRVAPLVFDAQGVWLPSRSVSALLATSLITRHAERLTEALSYSARASLDESEKTKAEAELQQLQQEELPTWMLHTFSLVLQRPDGLRIALGYLGHLSREVLLGRGLSHTRKDTWNVYFAAAAALATALRQAGARVGQVREVWLAAEKLAGDKKKRDAKRRRVGRRSSKSADGDDAEGARSLHAEGLPLLLGAAYLLGNTPESEAEIEAFWAWFDELLDCRDPGLSLITHGQSLGDVPQRFGFLVSRLSCPADRIRATYQKLEPQRRRALYGHRYEEIHEDLESVVLLRVAMNAATNWYDRVKGTDDANAARELFFWIYEAARRLWLTAYIDTEHQKENLVSVCFAFMPFLFGEEIGSALKRALPSIANDARMLAEACANLRLNGISAPKIRTLVSDAGADLVGALEDIHQWSQLTGRKEDFPPHLQQLATDLQLDFSQQKSTPESERTRALREAFVAAIPWGAALLRRLEKDGCSAFLTLPLNQQGNSWLIQAKLASEARDRFGLAPDIRILATLGMPRGQDIRRVMEESERSTDIDPDLLLVASAIQELPQKLPRLAGPWGQRVPWVLTQDRFSPLSELLAAHLPAFDIFDRRDPVRGGAFVGRRQEIEKIVFRLLRGQAVGVFGLRKVGKSSLLQAVAEQIDPDGAALIALGSRAQLNAGASPEALVVWLDVQSLVTRTQDAIAQHLWEELQKRIGFLNLPEKQSALEDAEPKSPSVQVITKDEAPSKNPLDNLRRLLLSIVARPDVPPICFMIDEYDLLFEGYGGEPGVAEIEKTFALLRSLGQSTGRVSVALIGRDPVFVEQSHLNGFTNPLLGWVESMRLGPLVDDDARELLSRLGRRAGLDVEPATVELALRLTGGHPLLLREFGAALQECSRAIQAPLPAKTTTLQGRASELFSKRDVVHTICGEIEVLLRYRFPDALTLLQQISSLPESELRAHLYQEGANRGRTLEILFGFGLLRGNRANPWIPLLYRQFFGVSAPISQIFLRSHVHDESFQEKATKSL